MDNNEEVKVEENIKEEEKTKKGKVSIIAILVVIVILLGVGIGFVLMYPKEKQSNKEEEIQEKEKKEEEKQETVEQENEETESKEDKTTNTEEKKENHFSRVDDLKKKKLEGQTEEEKLIDYVPVPSLLNWSDNGFLNKKQTLSDLNVDHLMFLAMDKLEQEDYEAWEELRDKVEQNFSGRIFSYKVADVKKSFENMYGTSLSLKDEISYDVVPTWYCVRVDDDYVCNKESGYCSNGPINYYFNMGYDVHIREYQKKEIDGKNLYLYVKYARVAFDVPHDACGEEWNPKEIGVKIYKYGTGNELIATANGGEFYEENFTELLEDKIYEKYGSQLTDYKITYMNNGGYYTFVSAEPVQ